MSTLLLALKRDPSSYLISRVLPAVIAITVAMGGLRWFASYRGWISEVAGVVLMTALAAALFTALAFWSARRLRAGAVAARESERYELYRLLARSYPAGGTFLFDRDLRYVLVEGTSLAEVGLSSEGMEGRLIDEVLEPDALATIEPIYRAALAGETTAFEMPYRGQHYRVTVGPTRDEKGNVVGGMAMTQQITEHKRLRDQLQQSQKMEALGQLAGGVAHDFNNLLLAIRGYSELVKNRPKDERVEGWSEEVIKAADQGGLLTGQLLAFSRNEIVQPRVMSLNSAIAETEGMLKRLLGGKIEIVTALDPDLGTVKADPGHLNQVLVNLSVNARDAMPEGGRLTIETTNVTLDESYAREHLGATPGDYVLLAVTDTGEGMDTETQARIFEPFFTTKTEGRGTGLGLSTVFGIVEQSGGSITVYSELNWGTVFRIYLPSAEAAETSERAEPRPRPERQTGARVLVVDDDPSVRMLLETFLREHGYSVDLVSSGAEALELCENSSHDLLLTDIAIPHMDGGEIARRASAKAPSMATLYMSGYTPRTIGKRLPPDAKFLAKPFTAKQLLDAVEEALAHPADK